MHFTPMDRGELCDENHRRTMPTIPIGVRVPGWDEDKWAITCERAPHEWSVHDVRVFLGAAARCLPSLSPDDLEYELLPERGGIRVRIFRGTHGEVVTYTPLALSAATRRALGVETAPVTSVLVLTDRESTDAGAVMVSPSPAD